MGVVIRHHFQRVVAGSALQSAAPPAEATAAVPRVKAPFAALLAKMQSQTPFAAGAAQTRAATLSGSTAPGVANASPARHGGTPTATATAATKSEEEGTKAGAEPLANAASRNPDTGVGGSYGHDTSAQMPVSTRGTITESAKSAGDFYRLPAPALPPTAFVPEVGRSTAAETSVQTEADSPDQSADDQVMTAAATVVPTLKADATQPSEPDPSADPDDASAESPVTPGTKIAAEMTSVASSQDANAADGALQSQHTPADPAAPAAVPQPVQTPPATSEWAEVREMVAFRLADAVQDGVKTVSIDLHPAELGHVGIELSFHAGGVSVQLTLSRQDTYEAFSRDRAALEQQLAQTGINLGGGSLDLRYDQKRDQPPAAAGNSFAARIQPMRPEPGAHPAAPPRTARGLLNIVA